MQAQFFDHFGGRLIRTTSDEFFAGCDDMFDVIFVDGDHRYPSALRDLNNSLEHLESGGLLIVDDVANSFHPEVEWAVRGFVDQRQADTSRYDCHPLFFRLDGCPMPTVFELGVFEKA